MSHVISVDNDTYDTLKRLAKDNERTMIGQIRYMMKILTPVASQVVVGEQKTISVEKKHNNEKQDKIQQLAKKLNEIDEESEEYDAILTEIRELQKEA